MPRLAVLILLTLAACGAAGLPQPPAATPAPGVTITGEVQAGVTTKHAPLK